MITLAIKNQKQLKTPLRVKLRPADRRPVSVGFVRRVTTAAGAELKLFIVDQRGSIEKCELLSYT